MYRTIIYGAGSIGNHLAHACRSKSWPVSIHDVDTKALERTKTDIYPSRYGGWDDEIELIPSGDARLDDSFELVIVGTPPDTHIPIALDAMTRHRPKAILIEKPACGLSMEGCDALVARAAEEGVFVAVAYNHLATPNTAFAEEQLAAVGPVQTLTVQWIEHWGGIYAAHPWLSGPADTYLGYAERGGGACGEHSHGINIWQHFARAVGAGRVVEVSAMLDMVEADGAAYDRVAQLHLRTETGLTGYVVQDVVTDPSSKTLRIQGENGAVEWFANHKPGHDAVVTHLGGGREETLFSKTRPDDFKGEIDHVGSVLAGTVAASNSPLALEHGLQTMLVVAAAHVSSRLGCSVRLDPTVGLNPGAIIAGTAEGSA